MFEKIMDLQFPRLLTQMCRDRSSRFYGCFDRNWWHYRIRDFASIILQQGGYTAWLYASSERYKKHETELKLAAHGAALFWNSRAGRCGAFEEYYPREKGYPPLAFSTLAMAKLVHEGVVRPDELERGMKKAAKQLQRRFEFQAGNQQVTGLAALAMIRKIWPELVNEKRYFRLKANTLELQHAEGWFPEYGGPDLGYLSVTLDCLWDLYDVTDDSDYLLSAEKGLNHLHHFVMNRRGGATMHNARNTDYIVPYGICRFLNHADPLFQSKSKNIVSILYSEMEQNDHFFHAIDDRYWSHYIGHSVVRAQAVLEEAGSFKVKPVRTEKLYAPFDASGYIFRELPENKRILVSPRKGGILTIYDAISGETILSDYGWIVTRGRKQYVTHWWSDNWKFTADEHTIETVGAMFLHRERSSTPMMHLALRAMGLLLGSGLTRHLRRALVFKTAAPKLRYRRKTDLTSDSVIVTDTIVGIGKKALLDRAPRASKRHVASADSFHNEDFGLSNTGRPMETIVRTGNSVVVTTIIDLFQPPGN
jgi:hypothetical protein